MKRKASLALCLLLLITLLSGCASQPQQPFAEVTQYLGPAVTETPTAEPVQDVPDDSGLVDDESIFASNPYEDAIDVSGYDALNEEGIDIGAAADVTVYPYAGSTPIPLIPVDAPTPTPRPDLTFTYIDYEIPSLGLTFQGPAGWNADASVNEMYTLTEPEQQLKDGQLGIVTLYAVPVNSNYTEGNLKSEVQQRLSTIGSTNFTEWKPSLTATRFLMGGKGVYANYSGTLADGVQVGGRIHCTCIDKVLYCLQITYPLGFKDDYLDIFSKIRETLKRASQTTGA